ncbi:MAG: DNA-3-methyladenine glycosylase [Acidimicrobiales bacterium]
MRPRAPAAPLAPALVPPLAPIPRSFYGRDSLDVAPELLNILVVAGERVGRIVEVEAYRGEEDPASHAYRGMTGRNATMFGPPGHLYVYLSYGMHWCANVVCGADGLARAVLLRAVAPVAGVEAMRAARPAARRDRDLGNGPGKLGQALGLTRDHDGADLVTGDRGIRLASDGTPPPRRPERGNRVGISAGTEHRWRWWVAGDPNVSRPPRPAPGPGTVDASGRGC